VEPDYLLDSEIFVSTVFRFQVDYTPLSVGCSGACPLKGSRGDACPPTERFEGNTLEEGGLGVKPSKEKLPCKYIF